MVCVHISSIIVQEGISFEDVQAFTELVEKPEIPTEAEGESAESPPQSQRHC